jgi:hypothetical protein
MQSSTNPHFFTFLIVITSVALSSLFTALIVAHVSGPALTESTKQSIAVVSSGGFEPDNSRDFVEKLKADVGFQM